MKVGSMLKSVLRYSATYIYIRSEADSEYILIKVYWYLLSLQAR